MNTIQPQTLKEWQTDRGMSNISLANKLNVDPGYISQIRSGKVKPGETLKDSFRKLYPGYDVIEMRPSDDWRSEKKQDRPILTREIYKSINMTGIKPKSEQSVLTTPEDAIAAKSEASEYITILEHPREHKLPQAVKVYVLTDLQDKVGATAHKTKLQAYEELAKRILEDPDAYGWALTEAELR